MDTQELILLKNRITQLEQENQKLHDTVAYLTKKLFGRSSEKSKALGIEGQLSFFDEAETESDTNVSEPDLSEVKEAIRKKKYKGQRKDKLENLPHDKVTFKLHPDELTCQCCNHGLTPVGTEFVRSEVEYNPATLRVIDLYRETYECRKCKQKGTPFMEKSIVPNPVISHSFASASSIANIMYQKYVNHLPLKRQETDFKNLGLNLSRQTMSNWIIEASKNWLHPLVNLLHKELLQEKYLHADETKVQVMKEKNRKNTTLSYMWAYVSYKDSKTPVRIFEYHPGRSGDYAKAFLNDFGEESFKGYLISDAYSGYDKVKNVTRCFCWSHLRRYFVDALPKDVTNPESTIPKQAIEYCNKLFKLEEEMEKFSPNERKNQRQKRSKRLVETFFKWVEENQGDCLPKSKLAAAFVYAGNQKEGLMRFLEDGNIPLSNNLAENSIRPFTVGRRNWLFCGSPRGADASALVYSIVETAKANNLNPYKYLLHIFKYLPGMRFDEEPEYLNHFLPWNPEIQELCKAESN
jgi:transposase